MFTRVFSFCRRILGCSLLLALGLPAARAQNVLYITDGTAMTLQAIDTTTGAILYATPTSSGALPIAVRDTIALGYYANAGLTGEYNRSTGALIGSLQTPTGDNWSTPSALDGAASSTANFTVTTDTDIKVYQTAPDWSAPSLIFTLETISPYGLTYDSASGNLWFVDTINIYQYTTAGVQVSFFPYGSSSNKGGLAYQASTDTLWLVPNSSNTLPLLQFSKTGTLLQTLTTPSRGAISGNVWGAEFQAIPEPSTYALIAIGATLLTLVYRRRLG